MKRYYLARALALGAALCGAPAFAVPLAEDLIRAAPDASADAIRLALAATECAVAHGQPPDERLALIDYSRASTVPRLWVFDLAESRLLYREWVAHGRNSGDNYARTFSNAAESHASSLGLFRTLDTYQGHNGYSLRLDGLEPGFNDHALERAIVMHGAPYVNPESATAVGRLGRSFGCPALRPAVTKPLLDILKNGQYVFSYYPDSNWLASSKLLSCAKATENLAVAASGAGTKVNDLPATTPMAAPLALANRAQTVAP
jgi:hypothetical protein